MTTLTVTFPFFLAYTENHSTAVGTYGRIFASTILSAAGRDKLAFHFLPPTQLGVAPCSHRALPKASAKALNTSDSSPHLNGVNSLDGNSSLL